MMGKNARQRRIVEIISRHDIDTQEELVAWLAEDGFSVTQATVSRDIRDLGLVKVMSPDGKKYRYQLQQPKDTKSERFLSVFRNTVLSIKAAENLIVVKTETGSANAAAETVDRLSLDGILGVIAGDNTIFAAVDTAANAAEIVKKLEEILHP